MLTDAREALRFSLSNDKLKTMSLTDTFFVPQITQNWTKIPQNQAELRTALRDYLSNLITIGDPDWDAVKRMGDLYVKSLCLEGKGWYADKKNLSTLRLIKNWASVSCLLAMAIAFEKTNYAVLLPALMYSVDGNTTDFLIREYGWTDKVVDDFLSLINASGFEHKEKDQMDREGAFTRDQERLTTLLEQKIYDLQQNPPKKEEKVEETPTPNQESKPAPRYTFSMSDAQKQIINTVLATTKGCEYNVDTLLDSANKVHELEGEVAELKERLQNAQERPCKTEGNATLGIPTGHTVEADTEALFPILKPLNLGLKVPAWQWDAPHPHVPPVDEGYLFKAETLLPLLLALKAGDNAWLSGHTGTGKTTLVEQVCARLNWPLVRIAFDHSIDRYELMGQQTLVSDGKGGTESKFNPGILEQTIPNGYVLLCDEFDCARPDSLYVMQDVLEHKTKYVLESNDETGEKAREIKYHPMTRLIATGNTRGNGDQNNLYPACRTLSAATLDRFNTWINVDYLSQKEEVRILKANLGDKALTADQFNHIAQFAAAIRKLFIDHTIPISFSPRRTITFARKTKLLLDSGMAEDRAVYIALQMSALASADADALQEVLQAAQRVFGIDISKSYSEIVNP